MNDPVRFRIVWLAFCDLDCGWREVNFQDRDHAVRAGKEHAKRCTASPDEYAFRVQGVRVRYTLEGPGEVVTLGDGQYEPHPWEPHPTRRSKGQSCGVCGIYRYLHDDIYGFTTVRA